MTDKVEEKEVKKTRMKKRYILLLGILFAMVYQLGYSSGMRSVQESPLVTPTTSIDVQPTQTPPKHITEKKDTAQEPNHVSSPVKTADSVTRPVRQNQSSQAGQPSLMMSGPTPVERYRVKQVNGAVTSPTLAPIETDVVAPKELAPALKPASSMLPFRITHSYECDCGK